MGNLAWRSANGAIVRPGSDVIDLFPHRFRQRDDVLRGPMQVLESGLAVPESRGRQRRNNTLLDFSPCPPLGNLF